MYRAAGQVSTNRGVGEYRRSTTQRLLAVIYVTDNSDLERAQRECLAACRFAHHKVVGLVIDDEHGSRWADTVRMLASGEADVIMVDSLTHLPEGRLPRVESAAALWRAQTALPSQRRPQAVQLNG